MTAPQTVQEIGKRPSGSGVLGRELETGDQRAEDAAVVHLDITEPRIGMIVGTRGSGKSHTLGVLAEELMLSRLAIGCVLVDRCGVFTQMNRWNDDGSRAEAEGPPRVRVLTVGSLTSSSLRFRPRDLLAGDWCRLTGISTEGPRSELVSAALDLVAQGYKTVDGRRTSGSLDPSVEDVWQCCISAAKLLDTHQGFTLSTRRSMIQKLGALDRLAILDQEAEPIENAVLPGWITVVDISDPRLSEVAATACVGLVARAVLRARFESVKNGQNKLPITWLLVDEAHLFAGPESVRSRTDDDLVQYCKLGRQPGCALVLATQQPGAMNPSILSQVDFAVTHRLTLRSDMDALGRVVPGIDSHVRSRLAGFDKGEALLFENDGEDAKCLRVRARYTQHNGRSAVPGELVSPPALESRRPPVEIAEGAEPSHDSRRADDDDNPPPQYSNAPILQSDTPIRHQTASPTDQTAIPVQPHDSTEEDTMRNTDSQRLSLSGRFGLAVILVGFFIGWKATNWVAERVGPIRTVDAEQIADVAQGTEPAADHEYDLPVGAEVPQSGVPPQEGEETVSEGVESPKSPLTENSVDEPLETDTEPPSSAHEGVLAREAQTRNMNALRFLR